MNGLGSIACAVVAALCLTATAHAAKPLPLEPTSSKRAPTQSAPIPEAFDAQYLLEQKEGRGPVVVTDTETARRYEPPVPSRCTANGLRFPELLLSCANPTLTGPVALNLVSGAQQAFPGDSDDLDGGPAQPDQLGWEEADSYDQLGSRWLEGTWSEVSPKPMGGAVYLDRQTGRRVTRPRAPQYDLDSPNLTLARPSCPGPGRAGGGTFPRVDARARSWLRARRERRGPGIDLVLQHCDRRASTISRCPSGCSMPTLTRRFVTWTSRRGFHVRSRGTKRSYTLRLSQIDAQRTLTAVTDRLAWVAFYRFARSPASDGYRVTRIALPRSIR